MNARILNHDVVTADSTPECWLYVLHGIFGAGRNWATVVRRAVAARPDWGALLVDLREHGASRDFAPPHTVAAAATDLRRLGEDLKRPASATLGHSFGGKVALQYAATAPPGLRQVWVVDSTPEAGEPSGSAWHMLGVVRSLPSEFESRTAGIDALVAGGVARPVAEWMATNLERSGDRLQWRFRPDSMDALLRDFFRLDLWSVVESPPAGLEIHFVRATRSSVLSPAAIARIRSAGTGGAVFLHEVEGGHWLNADNPDALVSLLAGGLPRAQPNAERSTAGSARQPRASNPGT